MRMTAECMREKPHLQSRVQECRLAVDVDADDWYVREDAHSERQIHLHFSDAAGMAFKQLLKSYALWRLGRVKPVTVRQELEGCLCYLQRYFCMRRLYDPRRFDRMEYQRFYGWLHLQGITRAYIGRIYSSVRRLVITGQRLGWAVSPQPFELPVVAREWESGHSAGAVAPIPPAVYEQILEHAMYDETDEITRCGILVQSQTGLRISEVLSLQEDCVRRCRNGTHELVYCLKKTQRGDPAWRRIPANTLVCEAVGRLRQATEQLRVCSGKRELFLVRNHGIRQASQTNWNQGRLKGFIRRWEITDADGAYYALHSHQFRTTYVSRQLLDGVPIEELQRRLGHLSAEMTMHYVQISQQQMETVLAPYIGNEEGLF